MRLAEYLAQQGRKKSKYGAKKTIIDGITFDSRREANYYCELKVLQRAGQVVSVERQVEFVLQEGFYHRKKWYRPIKYVADFVVRYADGRIETVDVKGFRTKEYAIKKKMLLKQNPDMIFLEV